MSSKTPMVRQVAWISLVPQLIFMGALIFGFYLLNSSDPIIHGALSYLAISLGLRISIPKDHRKGITLVKEHRFLEAIPHFEKSYEFFTHNLWIDKYRFLTLLSSSNISYREMALCNIAFCYSQTGDGKKAIEYYTRALQEFPGSMIAQMALKMLHSTEGLKPVTD